MAALAVLPATAPEEERFEPRAVGPDGVRFLPGRGLRVRSSDGDFGLALILRGQLRHTVLDPSDGALVHQLRLRRGRASFKGHFFGEHNRIEIQLAFSPEDVGIDDNLADGDESRPTQAPLLDFFFEFTHLSDLTVRIGQYKLPSNRERITSSRDLQLVDRGVVDAEFSLDRDFALDLRSKNLFDLDLLRYYAGVGIGRGRDSQGFEDFGLTYFGRLEVLPFGLFHDHVQADFARTLEPRLSVGVAYAYQDRARGLRASASSPPDDGGTTDQELYLADAIFKIAGLSIVAEAALRRGERNPGDAAEPTPPRDGCGVTAQAGYLLPWLPLEITGRYGAIRRIGSEAQSSLDDLDEAGGGLTWYVARHWFKIQADVFWRWRGGDDEPDVRSRLQLEASL